MYMHRLYIREQNERPWQTKLSLVTVDVGVHIFIDGLYIITGIVGDRR
jgi:hypothetical protein